MKAYSKLIKKCVFFLKKKKFLTKKKNSDQIKMVNFLIFVVHHDDKSRIKYINKRSYGNKYRRRKKKTY